jgi:hypothetical protein
MTSRLEDMQNVREMMVMMKMVMMVNYDGLSNNSLMNFFQELYYYLQYESLFKTLIGNY